LAFGDFYDYLYPNVRRWKRHRIYGTVTGAFGGWRYTIKFDCGQLFDCFSNLPCLEKSSASLPPVEIQTKVSEVEAEKTQAKNAAQITQENKQLHMISRKNIYLQVKRPMIIITRDYFNCAKSY